MKTCSKCYESKDESEFYRNKAYKDGLQTRCKICQQILTNDRYQNKKDQINLTLRNKYKNDAEHKQHEKERHVESYQENKEKLKQEYIDNKPIYQMRKQRYYIKNKSKINKKNYQNKIQRLKIDPLFKLRNQIGALISNSLRKKGYSKKTKTYKYLQCSYKEFSLYLGFKPIGDIELDHICPCAQAQNEDELIKLQKYTNFRWLNAEENNSKNDNWTPEGEELCRKLLGREWIYA